MKFRLYLHFHSRTGAVCRLMGNNKLNNSSLAILRVWLLKGSLDIYFPQDMAARKSSCRVNKILECFIQGAS